MKKFANLYLALVFVILYIPIAYLIFYSFNQLDIFFNGINFEECTTPNKIDEKKYPKIRDIKDLPVLVSAILSDSDILLTGDKDFGDIKIDKPLIFTPAKYFELKGK